MIRLASRGVLAGTLLIACYPCSAQVTATGIAPVSPAATIKTASVAGYNRSIQIEDFKGQNKAVILQMQQQLESIYQNFPEWQHDFALKKDLLKDGIVGPITLSWLRRFAASFKIDGKDEGTEDYANEIIKNVARIASFGARQPADLTILLSPEFSAWIAAQPAQLNSATQTNNRRILRQGSDTELTDLVNRFRGNRNTPSRSSPQIIADESAYFNYSLNQSDLDLLASKNKITQILSTLKDKEFSSTDALRVAVKQAMGGRDYFLNQVWALIEKNAAEFDGYLINDAALTNLKATSDFPVAVVDELRPQAPIYFKTQDLLDTFLSDKFSAETLDEAGHQSVADASRVFDNVHLTEQSISTIQNELKGNIQNAGVPAVIVRLLGEIKDVSYPETSLLRNAAISKIAIGIGACKANWPANDSYVASLRIADDEFDLLKTQLAALQPQTIDGKNTLTQTLEKSFADLAELRSQVTPCKNKILSQSQNVIQQIYQTYLALVIENTAKKRIPDVITNIHLKGGNCGCALDEFSGVIYGFYPYWNNAKTAQTMNFSVLNRVAYYGLSVDNVGDLHLGAQPFDVHDGSANSNEFLRIAHQYNSKVDWLIQKNDWNGDWKKYSHADKQAVLAALITNIGQLLRTRLSDTASRLKPYTSLSISTHPLRGDGITLYFQNYPTDADSTLLFNEFYLALRNELEKRKISVNILVAQDVLDGTDNDKLGAFNLANMITLRQKTAQQDNTVDRTGADEYLLVLLNEPSTDAKKQLRLDMDHAAGLTGAVRLQFLRSIIPVLQFDNRNWQQLEDDIIYTRDSFGGVGLWAPNFDNIATPVTDLSQSCAQSQQIAVCLLKNFREPEQAERIPSAIEKFTCVYRWFLQLAFNVFVVAAIVIIVLFVRSCAMQALVKRYFLWIFACVVFPPMLIFILLLLYDPFLANLSKGNLPFIIAIGVIVAGLISGYLFWRSQRRIPQRQRAMPQRQGLGFPVITWTIENDERGFHWIIRNRGTGYAIIKKIEILLDGQPVADAKTALEAVQDSDKNLVWKSLPLVGQKILPGQAITGLTISDPASGISFDRKLREHQLQVHVTYSSANNEMWISDGKEVSAVAGTTF